MRRLDHDDVIFQTKKEKYAALIEEIERINGEGLPILVGTTSVEVSEVIARMLKRRGLAHEVLNAKQHAREAEIVRNAGQPGAITIATNMAGRGTDIKLASPCVQCDVCGIRSDTPAFGRTDEEPDLSRAEIKERGCEEEPPCGLQILGTERHQSRRIDRQLRGRSGRQGDPGASLFFLSLEDDLMRLFMHERVAKIMDRLGVQEGEVISHPWITKSVERAQKRVETQNFGRPQAPARLRRRDEPAAGGRLRPPPLCARGWGRPQGRDVGDGRGGDPRGDGRLCARGELARPVEPPGTAGAPPDRVTSCTTSSCPGSERTAERRPRPEKEASADNWAGTGELYEAVIESAHEQFRVKLESFDEHWEQVLRFIVLSVLDEKWKDHLYDLDHLRSSIQFRSWGQKDPLVEYKKEAYEMFVSLITDIRKTVANRFFRIRIEVRPPVRPRAPQITGMSGPAEPGAGAVGAASGVAPGPGAAPAPEGASGEPPAAEPAFSATGVAASAAVQELAPDDTAARAALGSGPRPRRTGAPATATKTPGRNEPCHCGSGRKYKKCHGRPG